VWDCWMMMYQVFAAKVLSARTLLSKILWKSVWHHLFRVGWDISRQLTVHCCMCLHLFFWTDRYDFLQAKLLVRWGLVSLESSHKVATEYCRFFS
jgi:hypothetical protein